MLTNKRDEFSGQSRSPNTVPFNILNMVSYLFYLLFIMIFVLKVQHKIV